MILQKQFLFMIGSIVLQCSLFSSAALAWGDRGHEIVGDIAEVMVEPKTLDFLRGILGIEPLSVAAIFPDKVRDDEVRFSRRAGDGDGGFDFSGFHICDVPHGESIHGEENLNSKNAYSAIVNAERILKDQSGKYKREAKMLALRYLIHIVGDVHQPLHLGNGLDLGGNTCLVRDGSQVPDEKLVPEKLPTINFHSFWDDNIVQHMGRQLAEPDEKTPRFLSDFRKLLQRKFAAWFSAEMKTKVSEGSVADWMNESLQLRDSGVYPGDVPPVSLERAKARPYCRYRGKDGQMSSIENKDIPVLDKAYVDRFTSGSEAIVPTQLLKAGLRLAKILDGIASEAGVKQQRPDLISKEDQNEILDSVVKSLSKSSP